MYIKSLILFSLFLSILKVSAQQNFNTTITEPKTQVIHDIQEDGNGNFILVGRNKNTESEIYRGYIIKLNSYGEVTNDTIVTNVGISSMFFNIICRNENYVLVGSINDTTTSTSNHKLWFLTLDHNFNILESKILNLPEENWVSYINTIVDSDGNYVLTGYTGEIVQNQTVTDPFYYKLTPEGDSITSIFLNDDNPLSRNFDIIEKNDNSGFYTFSSHLHEAETTGTMVELTENFEIVELYPIPMSSHDNYSPIKINNSYIINTNEESFLTDEADLNLMKIDTNANLINNKLIGMDGDTADYPSYTRGTSRVGLDAFYASGTANISESNPFYGNGIPNWILLGKYNSNLDEQWLKYYGGDAYYHVYSMTTTSDHGCAVVASRFDYENPETDRDIFVMKVNGDGLITWNQSIEPKNSTIKLYPNPGQNRVNVDVNKKTFILQFYDVMGNKVLQAQNKKTINVSQLKTGVYFYRITSNGKLIGEGKWVKE